VPSLRNIALTPSYFYDGSTETLAEAVKVMGKYQLGRDLFTEELI
jgi:cytochrome c peroxidase